MKKNVLLVIFLLSGTMLFAQSGTFEFAYNGKDTTITGPSKASQTIYFSRNTNNPSGNTFADTSIDYSVSFSLINQQYTTGADANSFEAAMLFGAMSPSGSGTGEPSAYPVYINQGAVSDPTNSMFTSVSGSTDGIEVEDASFGNRNFAVEIFMDVKYLGTQSNAERYYYGDLVLNFSKPVSNPVLQLSGLGSRFQFAGGRIGYSTELALATAGYTLSLLDGNTNLAVTNDTVIENTAIVKDSDVGAASGSVVVNGSSITMLTFRLYIEGDGQTTHINWNEGANPQPGDGFLIGISLPNFITLPITLQRFTTINNNCNVKVDFTTGTEDNVHYIRLQHSPMGNGTFTDIYEWQPRGDNSSYQYLHATSSRTNFYRLAVTDKDSSKSYSFVSVATLPADCIDPVLVYPNPASDNVTIQGTFSNDAYITLIDAKGRLLKEMNLVRGRNLHTLSIRQLPPGQYFLLIKDRNGIVLTRPVIKQ